MTSIVDRARTFALAAHEGQVDKLGVSYAAHLAHVAASVARFSPAVQAVAWLHDSVEDCDVELDDISERFGVEIAAGVDAMTRRAHEKYHADYLPRLMANPLARVVKFADSRHNYGKAHLLDDPALAAKLRAKYEAVFDMLTEHDPEMAAWGAAPDLVYQAGMWVPSTQAE